MKTFDSIDWAAWVPRERAVLLFVVQADRVLLIHKKRGLGAGKINGPGGRIEPGETPAEAAVREVREELCTEAVGVTHGGELHFQFADGYSIHVHVFRADDCIGEPRETDEAVPMWAPLAAIPYAGMWQDDPHWLPLLLERRPFKGYFLFDGDRMQGFRLDVDGAAPGAKGAPRHA